jgi:hypothetical protein
MSGIWPDDIQCVALITFDVDGVSSWLRRDADNQAPVNNGTRLFGILMRWAMAAMVCVREIATMAFFSITVWNRARDLVDNVPAIGVRRVRHVG